MHFCYCLEVCPKLSGLCSELPLSVMLCPVLRSVLVCKDCFSYNTSEQGEAVAEVTRSVGVPGCHCSWNFHGCRDGTEGKASSVKVVHWVGRVWGCAQRQSLPFSWALKGSTGGAPSAVLCSPQVLLVSSSRHPDRWIVPGGGMEPEEEPSVAAVREVCEEVSGFTLPC